MQESEINALVAQCQAIPRAQGNYLITDFLDNLILTVIDFQMQTTAVERAHRHFQKLRGELQTIDDLKQCSSRFDDSQDGNTELAMHLWGYKLWTRAAMLRRLTEYFESIGVTNQERLRHWATTSNFKEDFEGRVKGLGIAVYNWLVMRQGIETVKPDVHVRRFVEDELKRQVSDSEIVALLEEVARRLEIKAYELDWAIWEHQRSEGE